MSHLTQRAFDVVENKWVTVLSRGYAVSEVLFAPGVTQYISNEELNFEEEDDLEDGM